MKQKIFDFALISLLKKIQNVDAGNIINGY